MTNKVLHPSIESFKVFVKNHPRVMEEVRSGKLTLQELYEEWFLLGEDDTRWMTFVQRKKQMETLKKQIHWMKTVLGQLKNESKSNATLSWSFKSGNWSYSRSCCSVSKWICTKS